jgi:hypothetical protein
MERIAALEAWDSFYVIVGSSAAALTGLQFVVISIISEQADDAASRDSVGAFGTPTVVHFCAALLLSAVLSAPWHSVSAAIAAIGLCGVAGVVYTAAVVRAARLQRGYKPVMEDWIWHAVLPLAAYVTLLAAVVVSRGNPQVALFLVAGSTILLLFIGIHNAWDTVTYMAIDRRIQRQRK